MPLDGIYRRTVVFIVGLRSNRQADGSMSEPYRTPIGTGFIVRWPGEEHDSPEFCYVVTARHCVEQEDGNTWIRIRTSATDVEDVPVPAWGIHPDHDVAVTPILKPENAYGWAVLGPETLQHPQNAIEPVSLGDRVYFIGLLQGIPGMADQGTPMVRSGTLGAEFVPRVPVQVAPDTTFHFEAHLIDCRSFSGFSGSPCFIQHDRFAADAQGRIVTRTVLLGLIMAQVTIHGMTGDRANAGVGVVVPVNASGTFSSAKT